MATVGPEGEGPKELRNIRLTEVSLVRRGANQRAKALLIKAADGAGAQASAPRTLGQRVRAALSSISAAVFRKDEEAPMTTAEMLAHEQRCEAYRSLRWAFMDSVSSIWESAAPNRRELMVQSAMEFLAGVMALMPDPPAPAPAEGGDAAMAESASAASVAKELLLPTADELIAPADAPEDAQAAHILKELAALEAALNLPAPAAENGEPMSLFKKEEKTPAAGTAAANTNTSSADETVALKKALEEKDAETVALKKALADAEAKAAAAKTDAEKNAAAIADLRKDLDAQKQANIKKELETELAGLVHDGLSKDEAVEALQRPTADHVRKLMKAMTAQAGKLTGLMKSHGFRGGDSPAAATGVVARVEKAAMELMSVNKGMSIHQARAAELQKLSPEDRDAFNTEKAEAAGLLS